MMEENKRVPKRRFEGFVGEWEEKKLGEHTKLITKGTTPKDRSGVGDVNFIKVENITNGKVIPTSKISYDEHEGYLKRSKLKVNDILFSIAGTLGRTTVIDETILPANTNQALAIIRGHTFDNNFLIVTLSGPTVSEYIRRNPTIGAQPNLSLEQVGSLKIATPSAKEQQKIGHFFKQLDDQITLQQRKVDKAKALKTAYLAEMFPAEGETVPERRFAGFTGEWKKRTLSQLVDKAVDNRGKTPPLSVNGEHPLIEVASLGSRNPDYSKVEKFLDNHSFIHNLRGYIKENDILFSTVGKIGLVSLMDNQENAVIAQNIVGFRAKQAYVSEYLYALFSTNESKVRANKIVMGAVQPSIKVSQLVNVSYTVTDDKQEQQKIGEFFKKLDDKIAIEERRLEKLQVLKEAYLHEMFV